MPDTADAFDPRAFHAQFEIAMIVACSRNGVIGRDGDLPWHLPEDLKHFMRSTRGCPVIMGRKTYESLDKPLPARSNIVVSRSMDSSDQEGVSVAPDLDVALSIARDQIGAGTYESPIWIAGGGTIYDQMLDRAELVVRTLVDTELDGDAHFPDLSGEMWKIDHSADFSADDRHAHPFSIQWLTRRS